MQGGFMKTTLITLILLLSGFANADLSTTRNYKDVTAYIHKLATQYPQNAELFTLGFSDQGVAIEGIKLGKGNVHNLVVGTHHGNEYGSTELALGFAESVAQTPIANQTLYVIPVLNIDGFNNRNRYERVNGQAVDVNRDYPGPCGTEGPFHSRSSKALADFIEKEGIVASATLHTYWPAAVYPWGLSTHDIETPYTPIFMNMVKVATETSHYGQGNSGEVIYPADGTFEDYAFWKQGIWSILFEVGDSHYPDTNDLKAILSGTVPGMRKMFEVAPAKRAENHEFKGRCDTFLRTMDLHIE
jgi:carboxypeptidase T